MKLAVLALNAVHYKSWWKGLTKGLSTLISTRFMNEASLIHLILFYKADFLSYLYKQNVKYFNFILFPTGVTIYKVIKAVIKYDSFENPCIILSLAQTQLHLNEFIHVLMRYLEGGGKYYPYYLIFFPACRSFQNLSSENSSHSLLYRELKKKK